MGSRGGTTSFEKLCEALQLAVTPVLVVDSHGWADLD